MQDSSVRRAIVQCCEMGCRTFSIGYSSTNSSTSTSVSDETSIADKADIGDIGTCSDSDSDSTGS